MPHRIFSLQETADYLHLAKTELEELVRQHQIPFEQRGARRIFRKKDLDAWASQRILGFSKKHLTSYHKITSAKIHDLSRHHAIISELVSLDHIHPAMTSKTKPSLLRDIVRRAEQTQLIVYPRELLHSLQEREQLCSTALPDGIALPHPRHQEPYMFEDSFIVIGKTVQPIPFGATDGKNTDLFFLICCQDDRIHLHVLARICLMCKQTALLFNLRGAPDAAAIHAGIIEAEEKIIKQVK